MGRHPHARTGAARIRRCTHETARKDADATGDVNYATRLSAERRLAFTSGATRSSLFWRDQSAMKLSTVSIVLLLKPRPPRMSSTKFGSLSASRPSRVGAIPDAVKNPSTRSENCFVMLSAMRTVCRIIPSLSKTGRVGYPTIAFLQGAN